MATTRRTRFSRRIPDHVTDELVVVLNENNTALEFNNLFELVYENLKEKLEFRRSLRTSNVFEVEK